MELVNQNIVSLNNEATELAEIACTIKAILEIWILLLKAPLKNILDICEV
jgi:hypothetical protein